MHGVAWDGTGWHRNAMEWNRIVYGTLFSNHSRDPSSRQIQEEKKLTLVGSSPVGANVFEVWNEQVSLGTPDQDKHSGPCP